MTSSSARIFKRRREILRNIQPVLENSSFFGFFLYIFPFFNLFYFLGFSFSKQEEVFWILKRRVLFLGFKNEGSSCFFKCLVFWFIFVSGFFNCYFPEKGMCWFLGLKGYWDVGFSLNFLGMGWFLALGFLLRFEGLICGWFPWVRV